MKNTKIEKTSYLCVDKDGDEGLYSDKPIRHTYQGIEQMWSVHNSENGFLISLPTGTIAKMIGKILSWDDEPYELIAE